MGEIVLQGSVFTLRTHKLACQALKHEFLDSNYKKERTVFADGTTITVDWDKKMVEATP